MLLVEDDYELLFCSTPSPLAPIRKFVPTNARPATPKDIFLYHSKKSHSLLGPGMSLNNASLFCSHFQHTWSRQCSKMFDELKLISSYTCINYDIWKQTVLSIHACVSKDYVCISLSLSLSLSLYLWFFKATSLYMQKFCTCIPVFAFCMDNFFCKLWISKFSTTDISNYFMINMMIVNSRFIRYMYLQSIRVYLLLDESNKRIKRYLRMIIHQL